MYMSELLAQFCSAMGFRVLKSTIKNPTERTFCFARITVGERNVAGYFNEMLLHLTLYWRQHDDRMFWEGALQMSVTTFKLIQCIYQTE